MSLKSSFYLVDDKERLWRIPKYLVENLVKGGSLSVSAGERWKVIEVLAMMSEGKQRKIVRTVGSFWYFDEHGKIDIGLGEDAIHTVEEGFLLQDSYKHAVANSKWLVSTHLILSILNHLNSSTNTKRDIRSLKLSQTTAGKSQ